MPHPLEDGERTRQASTCPQVRMSSEDDVKTEVAGVEVNWTHFLTGRDDATIANVSFLSRPAEWHALAVGLLAVLAPDVFMAVAPPELRGLAAGVPVVGLGAAYTAGRAVRKYADTLHFRDALREPAYTVLGLVLGTAVVYVLQLL